MILGNTLASPRFLENQFATFAPPGFNAFNKEVPLLPIRTLMLQPKPSYLWFRYDLFNSDFSTSSVFIHGCSLLESLFRYNKQLTMKLRRKLQKAVTTHFFSALLVIAVHGTVSAQTPEPIIQQSTEVVSVNSSTDTVVLKLDELYGLKVVKISFNGAEVGTGSLQVADSSGKIVFILTEIDLSPEPYYYALNCGDLPKGDCTFYISTKKSHFKATIKL